jgi:hypothetical protein
VTPPAQAGTCATMNIDEQMEMASHQYGSGFAKTALQIVVKALACKQNVMMYRLAATYACAAHDAASAKLYFTKVPAQNQPAIIQRCQQEAIDIRPP